MDNSNEKPELSHSEQEEIWIRELQENKALQEYLADFLPDSVKNFEKHYVSQKYFWINFGPPYTEEMKRKASIGPIRLPAISKISCKKNFLTCNANGVQSKLL